MASSDPETFRLTPEMHQHLFGYPSDEIIAVGTIKAMWVAAYAKGNMTAEEVRAATHRTMDEIMKALGRAAQL